MKMTMKIKQVIIIGASLSEPHMNVKSGARMCNIYICVCMYVCVFISYAVRRVARACMHAPSASASARHA